MFLYVKYVAVEGTIKLRNRTEITLIFPDSRSEWRRSSCRGLRRRRSFSDPENHRRRQDHEQSPDLEKKILFIAFTTVINSNVIKAFVTIAKTSLSTAKATIPNKNLTELISYVLGQPLNQGWAKNGPRTKSGPLKPFVRPVG